MFIVRVLNWMDEVNSWGDVLSLGSQLWFQRAGQWQVSLWIVGHDAIGSEVNAQDIRERSEEVPGITVPDDLHERQKAIAAQIVELYRFNKKFSSNFASLGEALQYAQDQMNLGDLEMSRLRRVNHVANEAKHHGLGATGSRRQLVVSVSPDRYLRAVLLVGLQHGALDGGRAAPSVQTLGGGRWRVYLGGCSWQGALQLPDRVRRIQILGERVVRAQGDEGDYLLETVAPYHEASFFRSGRHSRCSQIACSSIQRSCGF